MVRKKLIKNTFKSFEWGGRGTQLMSKPPTLENSEHGPKFGYFLKSSPRLFYQAARVENNRISQKSRLYYTVNPCRPAFVFSRATSDLTTRLTPPHCPPNPLLSWFLSTPFYTHCSKSISNTYIPGFPSLPHLPMDTALLLRPLALSLTLVADQSSLLRSWGLFIHPLHELIKCLPCVSYSSCYMISFQVRNDV